MILSVAIFTAWVALGVGLVAWRLKLRQRWLLGVLIEQVRREENHHVKYRPDQRLRACQQRLARIAGVKAAYGPKWTARLVEALKAYP